jgi:hypothetical protein
MSNKILGGFFDGENDSTLLFFFLLLVVLFTNCYGGYKY